MLHDYAPDNVVKHIPIRNGDVAQGFAEADLVVEETYETQQVEHAYLEPEAGPRLCGSRRRRHRPVAEPEHHAPPPHAVGRIIALPINKVRMIMSPVGGGFGGKEDMIYQGMLALLAIKTRRPVRLVFTREESVITTAKRHPARIHYRMGLKRDGRIVAVAIRMVCDGGAYGMSTEGVVRKAAILAAGPYAIPQREDRYLRRLHQQHAVGRVPLVRRAADAIRDRDASRHLRRSGCGLDPFEIRRINAMRDGAVTHTKQQLGNR